MYKSTAANVLTAILATLLSIFLVLFAFSATMSATLTSLVQPDSLTSFVQNIDFTTIFLENGAVTSVVDELGVKPETLNAILDSEAAEQIIGTYAESITSAITGKGLSEELSVEKFQAIITEHKDELVSILQAHAPEEMSAEKAGDFIDRLANEAAGNLVGALPSAPDLIGEFDPATSATMELVFGPTVFTVLTLISVALAALIFACRYKRCGGLLWIGIDAGIAGILVALVTGVVSVAKTMVNELLGLDVALGDALFSVVTDKLVLALVILFGITLVCVVATIVLRKTVFAKKAPAPQTVPLSSYANTPQG